MLDSWGWGDRERWVALERKGMLRRGDVTVLPWKLSATLNTMASFCGTPLTLYAHFRATLTAVSTASAPVFIGRTMSKPKYCVTNFAKRGKTSL